MKVTIQYSAEIGEVPFKVEELYNECREQMKTLNSVASSLDILMPDIFVERINSLREKMVVIDSKLEECSVLMRGYSEAFKQEGSITVPKTKSELELLNTPDFEEDYIEELDNTLSTENK